MSSDFLARLAVYSHLVVSWIGDDGYPVQTAAGFRIDVERGEVRIGRTGLPLPDDREVNVVASHIRPQPGTGYDQRRYLSLWGRLRRDGDEAVLRPARVWGWDEAETPFFEYVERSNTQAKRYLHSLSLERGEEVKPRLSPVWTFLLATRLPFLTATIVPILLGIAVAARGGHFSWWLALLTLLGGAAIHIGLNTANDIFDALSGADEANYTPTQFSGGSRVIQRGLVSLGQMCALSAGAYVIGISIGITLVLVRGSLELLAIGLLGVAISVFYTAPPLRLVHRGLGEVATAIGFGPLMVLGAYVVQARELSWEAFVVSLPVAILIALVLYVNEIPDRDSDGSVGKRTLPARLGRVAVTRGFLVAALAAFAVVLFAAAFGVIPRPAVIALAALPLVWKVYRGIKAYYTSPYELMATMGQNVQMHLVVGMALFAGYMIAEVASAVFDSPPAVLV
ncbi:MAG TPA: prenyltransferase [Dehalococcoidia bacterium]|nr:prenyltransferase [Dehalococcoidia bacterium]